MLKTTVILLVMSLLGLTAGYVYRQATAAPGPSISVHNGDFSAVRARVDSDVVLYSLAGCPFCAEAKVVLDSHGIDYVELDVGESVEARDEAKSFGAATVPFLLIGDLGLEGFDEAKLIAALETHSR